MDVKKKMPDHRYVPGQENDGTQQDCKKESNSDGNMRRTRIIEVTSTT